MSDSKYKHYMNRDLSWLQFNERVLEEAEDPSNPLFERLNFISIYHSNLTEFLRVRVGTLYDQLRFDKDAVDRRSGLTAEQQLKAINEEIERLMPRRNKALSRIVKELKKYDILVRLDNNFTKYELRALEKEFEKKVRPFLSPLIVDKYHPFPFVETNAPYVAVLLKAKDGKTRLGLIPCSGAFDRFPKLKSNKYTKFALVENVIYEFADRVFPKHKVLDKVLFSVTRSGDIDVDDALDLDISVRDLLRLRPDLEKGLPNSAPTDSTETRRRLLKDLDVRGMMELMVEERPRLEPIRVEMTEAQTSELPKKLLKHLGLKEDQLFDAKMPLQVNFVGKMKDVIRKHGASSELFYPPLKPQQTNKLNLSEPLIPQIQKKDVLLRYPYEDIRAFIKLLEEAADDPDVASIKITLYRVAKNSRIVDALIRAAENGKEVTAVVELRARFDEENNIGWAEQLLDAGVTLAYGMENYKVHSKLMVITRKKDDGVEFITQVGTGNYNEVTSRLYTDLSYITANEDIAYDALQVFQNLTMGTRVEESEHLKLLVSPKTLKPKIIELIDREIKEAKEGREALLRFKMNSLNDLELIDKIIEASDAGVKVELLVRGICCLKVSKTGKTRNIEVTSIVGRYLEHSRIYIFGTGEREKIYIASADFMTRNMDRRVEVGIPVTDPDAKQELKDIMDLMLSDNVKARRQTGNGTFRKVQPKEGEERIDSQIRQYEWAYNNAGNPFPEALKLNK